MPWKERKLLTQLSTNKNGVMLGFLTNEKKEHLIVAYRKLIKFCSSRQYVHKGLATESKLFIICHSKLTQTINLGTRLKTYFQ
jgi:hypothetical protein